MIDVFESSFRISPNQVFFSFIDSTGRENSYTYRQTRLISSALARKLQTFGVSAGDVVAVDLPTCAEYVFLILASAYGGFTIAALNNAISDSEKLSLILSLERDCGKIAMQIDAQTMDDLLGRALALASRDADDSSIIESITGSVRWERSIMGERQDIIDDTVHFAERAAHLFDESARALILFSKKDKYAGAKAGAAKSVPLTWSNLTLAATTANFALEEQGHANWQERLPLGLSQPLRRTESSGFTGQRKTGARDSIRLGNPRSRSSQSIDSAPPSAQSALSTSERYNYQSLSLRDKASDLRSSTWQCLMPFHTISGYQTLAYSIIGRNSLRLYETFDAEQILKDCEQSRITHVALTDKMLQDLLTVEEWRRDINPDSRVRLAEYQCILIVGHALNARTVERSLELNVRIFSSYGMTEASGIIAASRVGSDFRGGLKLLDGYEVEIIDADEDGFGRLAIQGPGVFAGYLNASAPFTVDHFFMTNDTAALYDGSIYVRSKSADMFVSGGENIYPAEIADLLRHVPGVSGVHVFGIADSMLGKRPIALVERSDPSLTSVDVFNTAIQWMPEIPTYIHIVDSLPRNERGKVDRSKAEDLFKTTICIQEIILHHVRLPLRSPLRSAYGTLTYRDSVIVEAIDILGRKGLGECVAFDGDWGISEKLSEDIAYMRDVSAPAIIGQTFHHPYEATTIISSLPNAEAHPMAASAIDCAIWDIYAQATERPFWKALNSEYDAILEKYGLQNLRAPENGGAAVRVAKIDGSSATVNAGAVIGLGSPSVTTANAHSAITAGYKRLKMKITPRQGFAGVRSVRRAFPDLLITLDANRSFTEDDIEQLKAYDELNIGWIEEPFKIDQGEDAIAKLNEMQKSISTPVCADESYFNLQSANRILDYPDIHCIAIKSPRFASIMTTLAFIAIAKAQGKTIWMGDMYDTGISRYINAAFETLPDMVVPGDIGSTSRLFETSICSPAFESLHGQVKINGSSHPYGIGCVLDYESLKAVEVESFRIKR